MLPFYAFLRCTVGWCRTVLTSFSIFHHLPRLLHWLSLAINPGNIGSTIVKGPPNISIQQLGKPHSGYLWLPVPKPCHCMLHSLEPRLSVFNEHLSELIGRVQKPC